ncbi:hypothetical protein [Novosphingobium sp. KN65.2]|uniref:hypothetical protein n=1 Tax=Novosphingobium sp. KN65.2 TaxID=1478134 RepID=UPI0005E7851E|nr:hypothetical protein [Novosphingobium sp. KN65.2]CDO34334.1 conserved exported hypothetical protein [Novosphingobium sp. KN65.2]
MNFKEIASLALCSALALGGANQVAMAASPASDQVTKAAGVQAEPNITGVWERDPFPFDDDGDETKLVPPPGGGPDLKEPYASEWKALQEKRQAMLKAGTPLVDASTQCLPEGTPGIMEAIYPIQILQNPGQITVLAELFMQTRRIYMNAPFPEPDDLAPSYYGFSSAHWEGDTLVVQTRGVQQSVKFYDIPHSDAMTVTEHYQLIGPDKLRLDVSVEDPEYLQKPYTFRWEYKRNPDYRIPEYVCDHRLDVINPDGTVSFGGAK